VAHIQDYLRPHSFSAVRGAGLLRARPGAEVVPEHIDASRLEHDLVEIVLLEAGRPDRHHFHYHDLSTMGGMGRSRDLRVRQIGSLALALCYVAVGIADVLVAAVRSRSVDIAAGLLILDEAGGGAATLSGDDFRQQPLDLEKRCAFVAWRAGLDGAEISRRARQLEAALIGPG
jgi:fructose-1,6-bisphosphatase/inositol monophosphatase family enzyme